MFTQCSFIFNVKIDILCQLPHWGININEVPRRQHPSGDLRNIHTLSYLLNPAHHYAFNLG